MSSVRLYQKIFKKKTKKRQNAKHEYCGIILMFVSSFTFFFFINNDILLCPILDDIARTLSVGGFYFYNINGSWVFPSYYEHFLSTLTFYIINKQIVISTQGLK